MKPFRGKRERSERSKGGDSIPSARPVPSSVPRMLPAAGRVARREPGRSRWHRGRRSGRGEVHFSPRVGRRDPLGNGLRPGMRPREPPRFRAERRFPGPRMSRPAPDGKPRGEGPLPRRASVRPGGQARRLGGKWCRGFRHGPGPRRLLVPGVLGRRPTPVSGASASDAFPTRLETRTKESNMCASRWEHSLNPEAQ